MTELSILHGVLLVLVGYVFWAQDKRAKRDAVHLEDRVRVLIGKAAQSEERFLAAISAATKALHQTSVEMAAHINSKDVAQKVDADIRKDEAAVHIEQLTDAYHAEMEKRNKVIEELEARLGGGMQVELSDGRKIDRNLLEPLT